MICCMMVVTVAFGRLISTEHAHVVKDMCGLFSLLFLMTILLAIYFRYDGELDANGNAHGELGSYFLAVLHMESDLRDGLVFSLSISGLILATSCLTRLLAWILGARVSPTSETEEIHVGLGVFLVWKKNSENGWGIPEMWLSVRPTKVLTVLAMKCFCAATATFSAMALITLAIYPSMGRGLTVKPVMAVTLVIMLGGFTLFAVLVNGESGPVLDACRVRLRARVRR